jgi:hypothetical protein
MPGIHLTIKPSQIKVVVKRQVKRARISRRKSQLPGWRICICVLLIGLVIYNPFLALDGTAGDISYEKLARNRATIGSSEMLHFSPVSNPGELSKITLEVIDPEPAAQVQENQPWLFELQVVPLQPEIFASLWFRPPPTL